MIDIYVERGMEPDDAEVRFWIQKSRKGVFVYVCLFSLCHCIDCLRFLEQRMELDDAEVRLCLY